MKTPIILRPSRQPLRRPLVETAGALLPDLEGRPIAVQFQRGLLAAGQPVHAATDIPKRVIVLDTDLVAQPRELARILIHEVFHFAWVRLGNPRRHSYAGLVASELLGGARGELGWSAEYRKRALLETRGLKWREYVCESFCDTAAWRYSKIQGHEEFTLSARHRKARERWFTEIFREGPIRV